MKTFVNEMCKNVYHQFIRISEIRQLINENVAKTLIGALMLSRLDYCSSLFAGPPNEKLHRHQLVQNNAVRLVNRLKKRDHNN